jgi:hypothetical protein
MSTNVPADKTSQPLIQRRYKLFSILINVIIPPITVVALALSWYQLKQAHQTESEIKEISGNIKEVAGSISTQYVDTFPANMPAIIDLIERTNSSLLVVTDAPAYGHFSNPSAFEQYRRRLEALASPDKKVKIRLLSYDDPTIISSAKNQFGQIDIQQVRKMGSYNTYFAFWKNKPQPKTVEDFYDLIKENNNKFRQELAEYNVEISETQKPLPVFLWMRDEKEAILSFYNYGQSPREVSFRTNDQSLIKILNEIADGAFKDSKRYEPQAKAK